MTFGSLDDYKKYLKDANINKKMETMLPGLQSQATAANLNKPTVLSNPAVNGAAQGTFGATGAGAVGAANAGVKKPNGAMDGKPPPLVTMQEANATGKPATGAGTGPESEKQMVKEMYESYPDPATKGTPTVPNATPSMTQPQYKQTPAPYKPTSTISTPGPAPKPQDYTIKYEDTTDSALAKLKDLRTQVRTAAESSALEEKIRRVEDIKLQKQKAQDATDKQMRMINSDASAQKLKSNERLSQMGITNSGAGLQLGLMADSARNYNINDLNVANSQTMAGLDNNINDVESQYTQNMAEFDMKMAMEEYTATANAEAERRQRDYDMAIQNAENLKYTDRALYDAYVNEAKMKFDKETFDAQMEFDYYSTQLDDFYKNKALDADTDIKMQGLNLENAKLFTDQQLQQTKDRQDALLSMGYSLPPYYTPYDETITKYSNDYQGRINELLSQGVSANDPVIMKLKSARFDKIMADPELRKAYGNEFRTQDSYIKEAQTEGIKIENATAEEEYKWLPKEKQAQYDTVIQDLEAGKIDIETAKIKLDWLPEQMKAEVDNIYSGIESREKGDNLDASKFGLDQDKFEFAKEESNRDYQYKVDKDGVGYYTTTPNAYDIISANEGDYGTVVPNDNGGLSIGKIQWHNERAGELIMEIYGKNPALFTGNSEIMSHIKNGNWAGYVPSPAAVSVIQKALDSSVGTEIQDKKAARDLQTTQGMAAKFVKDPLAQIYLTDFLNQYGDYSTIPSQAGVLPTDNVTQVHKKITAFTNGAYSGRRDDVHRKLTQGTRIEKLDTDTLRAFTNTAIANATEVYTEEVEDSMGFTQTVKKERLDKDKFIGIIDDMEMQGKLSPQDADAIISLAGISN